MTAQYNPFPGKSISQITSADLELLTSISEGWYVEYKRELPNPKAIAKAISAFANTYGGWIFIGIQESGNSDNTAASYPGISATDLDRAMQSIRQSVSSHTSPVPHFEIKAVSGTHEKIDLPEERSIICIEVPQSSVTPHVHSSGVIFRRVSDGSEAKPENDRHQLDILFRRRKIINKSYKRWIKREPEPTFIGAKLPYLRILIDADNSNRKGITWDLKQQDLKDLINDKNARLGTPVDVVYPSANGTIARQTSSLNHLEDFGLTWVFGHGLRCEVWIPVTAFEAESPYHLDDTLKRYKHFGRFVELLHNAKSKNTRVFDLNQVWMVLLAASTTYLRILDRIDADVDHIYCKAILGNSYGAIPFIDSKVILDRFENFGVPFCITSNSMIPGGTDADTFFEIEVKKNMDSDDNRGLTCATLLFELACYALGFQALHAEDSISDVEELYSELIDAWERARPDNTPPNP